MAENMKSQFKRPIPIALAVAAALGWLVALWVATERSNLRDTIAEREVIIGTIEDLELRETSLQDELEQLSGRQATIQEGIAASEAQAAEFQAQIIELQSQRDVLGTEVQMREQALSRLEEELAPRREELATFETRLSQTQDNLSQRQAQVEEIGSRLEEMRSQEAEVQERLAQFSEEASRLADEAASAQASLQQARQQEQQAQAAFASLQSQTEVLQQERQQIQQTVEELAARRGELLSDILAAREQRDSLQSLLTQLSQNLEARSERLSEIEERIEETQVALVQPASERPMAATLRSGELSAAQFQSAARNILIVWDADRNQTIDENEFYTGLYGMWNGDGVGMLTEEEYTEGWNLWFDHHDAPGYGEFDNDNDDLLTEDEFAAGLGETPVYVEWSGEGELDEETITTHLYAVYDANEDGVVTVAEYDRIGRVGSLAASGGTVPLEGEIIALSDWTYDDLYAGGVSAGEFIDGIAVYGAAGDEIGQVEDLIIGPDGAMLSVIAEVGGLWDIGDTHVSIPWSDVELVESGGGIVVPLTEENVDDYRADEQDLIRSGEATEEIISAVDDAPAGQRAWRASELIGNSVRVREGDAWQEYGYVNDLILRDGRVSAVVVEPDAAYGGGFYATPYYGYGASYGWTPGSSSYDLPYGEADLTGMDEFDLEEL